MAGASHRPDGSSSGGAPASASAGASSTARAAVSTVDGAGRVSWASRDGRVRVAASELGDGDLGRNTAASADDVAAARRALSRALDLPPVVDARQVHGTSVQVVETTGADVDWTSLDPDVRAEADAIVVPAGGVPGGRADEVWQPDVAGQYVAATPRANGAAAAAAAVLVADCVPLVLVAGDAFAVVHAGWRGLVDGVVERALEALLEPAGSDVRRVEAVLGPAIGPCCFEVGEEVAERFDPADVVRGVGPRPHVDLWGAAERRLRAAGVTRVDRIGGCTRCTPGPRWHSFRRDGAAAGRLALVTWRVAGAPASRSTPDLLQGP